MQIITTDTTWGGDQLINLTDDVQIASGVTLTIAPGAKINGKDKNGHKHQIQAYGTLNAVGTNGSEILFSDVSLNLSDNNNQLGRLILDHTQVTGTAIMPATGAGHYGSFSVTNSVISNSNSQNNYLNSYWYVWYPSGNNVISGNIFIGQNPISIGLFYGTIEISNNIFDQYQGGAITDWAAYGLPPLLSNNAYLMAGQPTLALQYDHSQLKSANDYFGNVTQYQLNAMIYDGNDTLSIPNKIQLENVNHVPSDTLPTNMFAYANVDMPSQIVKTARILGNSDVILNGNLLDNSITVGSGNNTIDGKDGVDTVVFHGDSGQYSFSYLNGVTTVTDKVSGRDGIDTLKNVEYLQFNNISSPIDDFILPIFQTTSSTNSSSNVRAERYSGPISYLQYQYIDPDKNAVVTGSNGNEFLKLSNIESSGKAVNGNGGTDVIDGGVGSTFVSGGTGHHSTTFFLDGRAPGVSWSTITDFVMGDNATIWGFVKGVSGFEASFNDLTTGGAQGYQGLTPHFTNLLADGLTSGTNSNLNSITLSGHNLGDFGASSIGDLINQISNASYNTTTGQYNVNSHMIIGQTQDTLGTHSYLYIH